MSTTARICLAFLATLGLMLSAAPAHAGGGGDNFGTCVGSGDYNYEPGYACNAAWKGTNDGCDVGCDFGYDPDCAGYQGMGSNVNNCGCWPGAATKCNDYEPIVNGRAPYAAGSSSFCSPNSQKNYLLHLGGMCSQSWTVDGARLGNAAGYTSVEVLAVQTRASGTQDGAATLKVYLDECCTGSNNCMLVNYSNGDTVTGYAMATYDSSAWNLTTVRTAAGAAGGSEIDFGILNDLFGKCDLSSYMEVSRVRNLYNHNATGSVTSNYHIGGYDGWLTTMWLLPGEDDGAVAYHSAGAVSSSGSYDTLCFAHWTNHKIAYTCTGYDLDHYGMKMKYISKKGW